MPFSEVSTEQHNSLYEYMNKPFTFFVDENQILNGYNKILEDIKDYNESKNTDEVFMYKYEEIMVDNFMRVETVNNYADSVSYNSKPMIKFKGNYDSLKDYVLSTYKKKYINYILK